MAKAISAFSRDKISKMKTMATYGNVPRPVRSWVEAIRAWVRGWGRSFNNRTSWESLATFDSEHSGVAFIKESGGGG